MKTFTVATTQDALAEGAETFTVTLSAPSGGFPGGISLNTSATTGTGTINLSDPATLSVNSASANEGSNVTFTVTLSGSPGAAVTVDFATSVATGNTAVQSDFTSTTGTLTFSAGATGAGLSKTFTVATTQDALAEGNETFTVTLSAPSGGFPGGISLNTSATTGTGTINLSDPATVSVNSASAAEGSNVTFTVTLSGSPGAAVTVDFATSVATGNTAVQADFTNTTGSVTFASGATGTGLEKTFTVATVNDALAEGNETFTVTLSAPSGGFPGGISLNTSATTGTGTINLSDAATLSVNDPRGGEGADVTFAVTLSGSPGAAVTVDYATSIATGDTAIQSDFTATSGTLTFAAGATGASLTQTFTVALTDDMLVEGDETFTVTLTEPSGKFPPAISISDATGTGTIGAKGSASLDVTSTSAAEGANLTFTVTLSASPGNPVTVDYATSVASGDTAIQSDFTSTSGTLTFATAATGTGLVKTFTVAATDDMLAEGAETFTVTLTEPSSNFPAGISIGTGIGTGTINLSDPASLSVSDASGVEGGNLTFTVTLSGSPGNPVTVDFASGIRSGDTAVQSDITSTTGSVSFAVGATGGGLTKTFTVAATDDELAEGDETFSVTLAEPSSSFPPAISLEDSIGQGTIGANDPATLSVSDASGGEGGNLTFTVTLSGSPAVAVMVEYATSTEQGDSAGPADYTSASGSLTFEAEATGGALSQTFTVAATADDLVEGAEMFTVTLSEPPAGFPPSISIGGATGKGTITASGSAILSVGDAARSEGGELTFTVTLSARPANAVTVDYATSIEADDTASESDFESTSGSLNFEAESTGAALSQTFTVAALRDPLIEGPETFTVSLLVPPGGFPAGVGISRRDGTAKGTITSPGSAELSVSDASAAEGGDLTFTVTLSGSPASAVTVHYATSVGPDDTASESDFESTSGSLTFEAEATGAALSRTFTVAAAADSLEEGAETFTVTLSAPSEGFPPRVSIGDATGTGTIAGTGGPGGPGGPGGATLSVSDAEGAEGDDLTFTVTLSASPTAAVTVDYATGIGSGDTASGSDFESASGSLTFAAGATGAALFQTFNVAAVQDEVVEGDETFTVTLSAPSDGLPAGVTISDSTGTGTITDPGALELSVNDASGAEGGDLVFTVSLSVTPATAVTVDYATGIGPGDTASGSDFESASGSLTFAAGATGAALAQTLTVATVRDDVVEGDETFTVTLSAPSAGLPAGVRIADSTGTGTITDPGAATLSVSDASGDEGDYLTFTVTLSASPAATVSVDYATGIASGDTASESDFESVSGSLTFPAGATGAALAQTFTVATIRDDVVEGDETFTVTLSAPTGGLPAGVRIADATGTGTITDATTPIVLAELSVSDASGDEGSDLTFTVTLSASPAAAVAVEWATSIGSGDMASPSDFESAGGDLVFAAGATGAELSRTFAVAAVADDLVEGDETFTVTLSAPSTGFPPGISISDATGTGTIIGGGSAELSVSDASGAEGGDLTFTVTLSARPGAPVRVNYATSIGSGDTATPSDFTRASGGLTFPAGAAGAALSRTFSVAVTDDELAEGDETFTVSLSQPSAARFPFGVSIADGTATGTIAASDAATLSISDAAGPEGSELTFAVSLSGSPGAEVEVAYATAIRAGDTAGVDDFTPANGTLRFAAGATGTELTRIFAVSTAADSRAEEDETFSVVLSETAEGFPAGIDADDVAGVGTITEDAMASGEARVGRVNEEVAPRLAQAVAASTLSAISGRIDAAATVGSIAATASTLTDQTGLGGPFDPFNAPGESWRYSDRALGGLSFAMPLEASESEGARRRRAAIWGSGDYYRLSDTDDSMVEWDGDVLSFHVGADMRIRPDLLGGVSVSRTSGSIEYMDRTDDVAAAGRYDTQMTSMHPYVSWSLPRRGLGLWATVGYGRGDVELDDALAGTHSSDMSMRTAAVGASGRLFSSQEMISGGTTSLRLKGEGSVALLDIEGRGMISPLTSDVQRLRLALEGSYARTLESGGMLTPSLELGVRHDGGDAVTGLGLELGGSLRYVASTIGLTLAGQGRVLVAHRDDGYEEWSVGGMVRLDPGTDRHGLSLTLTPSWGDAAGGGGSFGHLYNQQDEDWLRTPAPGVRQAGRVDAEIGYGLSGLVARGVVTPFAGLVLASESSRRYRLGSYLEFAEWLRLSVEAGREERGTRLPNHGVLLRAHLRW